MHVLCVAHRVPATCRYQSGLSISSAAPQAQPFPCFYGPESLSAANTGAFQNADKTLNSLLPGIKYPTDKTSGYPYVMTCDFMITTTHGFKARTVKLSSELTNPRTIEKLEIERRYWKEKNVEWKLVTEAEISFQKAKNIEFLYTAHGIGDLDICKNIPMTAVEAARAGVEGKGFAVVAEEVRSLAAKSAEAASQSSVLIREAINAVEKGKNIAETTAAALQTVSAKTQSVNDIFSVITKNSNEQATAITGIIEGMNQISIVAQANATTAEESSAISEELFDHTEQLKNEIKQFKL